MPFLQEIGVAVDDYHRVVHYHTQHEDECCERYGIQFNTHQVHQPQRNRDTYGYARACHEGCAQGEEHEHDKDDDHDRDEYVAQERGDRGIHHLRLVGNTMELQVGRQLRAGSLQLHLYLSSELHDVIARRHLHADNQAVGIFLRAAFVEIDIL